MGVLMLADAVEAASRTLSDPSRQKLRGLVHAIFEDCLHDNELDESGLTLGELRKVEAAFLRVLVNIFHQRIDYPGFEFNEGSRSMRRPPGGTSKKSKRQVAEVVEDAEPEASPPEPAEVLRERKAS